MNGAFYVGGAGLYAQQQALDIVANNIANLNTTAFKRSSAVFSALVAPPAEDELASMVGMSPSGALAGVVLAATPLDFTEGPLRQTGQPLDLAIAGSGFIELMGPSGQTRLWRGGSLQVNQDGYLAAPNGMALKAMIQVPSNASALSIGADGKVEALVDGDPTPTTLGRIDLAQVKDMTQLTALNDGLYQVDDDSLVVSGEPGQDGAGAFAAGTLEGSNVNLTNEMTTMLLLERAYGANAQVVQAGDQLMQIANNLKR